MADTNTPPGSTPTALLIPLDQARSHISDRITKGKKLMATTLKRAEELETAEYKRQDWHDYNILLLSRIFTTHHESYKYAFELFWFYHGRVKSGEVSLSNAIEIYNHSIRSKIAILQSLLSRLDLYPIHTSTDASETPTNLPPQASNIFIGHGHSLVWHVLKDFIKDTLHLPYDEFNLVPTPGLSNKERLQDMLSRAAFAFLIMTAEDQHADATLHPRENVIHETGLFQGHLGFQKAIVLLEEGCQDFSNMDGIGEIRFPKGNIKACFEEIRRVLIRETILPFP